MSIKVEKCGLILLLLRLPIVYRQANSSHGHTRLSSFNSAVARTGAFPVGSSIFWIPVMQVRVNGKRV